MIYHRWQIEVIWHTSLVATDHFWVKSWEQNAFLDSSNQVWELCGNIAAFGPVVQFPSFEPRWRYFTFSRLLLLHLILLDLLCAAPDLWTTRCFGFFTITFTFITVQRGRLLIKFQILERSWHAITVLDRHILLRRILKTSYLKHQRMILGFI